jgi:diamine N-acetyltransferase
MNIIIRKAVPSDSQNLAALAIQVWLHTYAKMGIRDVFSRHVFGEFTAERFDARINDETRQVFIAEISNHLIGYVQLNMGAVCPIRNITQPEVETLYVQEHFIGRHIGSALLENALAFCRSLGNERVWLLVNQENLSAREFYINKRFQKIGVVDFELENERHANDVLISNSLSE